MDGARGLTRSSTAVRWALASVLVGAVLVCWAASIGRYGGPDEPAHVVRAHAVAQGDVLGAPATGLAPGYRVVTVPASLGTGDPACYRHDPTVTSDCSVVDPGSPAEVRVATSAGANPPLYYALVGGLARLFGAGDDPLGHRLAALSLVAAVLGAAAARLRLDASGAAVLAALSTPACWFLWGVVNPNGLEIALLALAATSLVRRDVGAAALWLGAPLAVAIAMRPIGAAWALAVLVVAEIDHRSTATWRDRLARWAPPAGALVSVAIWSAWSDLVVDDERTARTGGAWTALGDSLGGLPRTAVEAVASTGWLEFWAPWPAVAAWLVAVAVVVVAVVAVAGAASDARRTWVPGRLDVRWSTIGRACALTALVVPVAFEVLLYRRIGPIWQGRYLLPLLAVAVVGAAPTLRRLPAWAARSTVVSATVMVVTTHWAVVRRYAVGTDGSWWFRDAAATTTRWLGPGTWVLVHAAIVVACGAGALRAISRPAAAPTALDTPCAPTVQAGADPQTT